MKQHSQEPPQQYNSHKHFNMDFVIKVVYLLLLFFFFKKKGLLSPDS